ncbi:hypothetical protein KJ762_09450 [bacterium]|nr:hypothetical protein [bacterium]MBU1063971.1 hypothetical protein [bacterium]MBU1634718.1 hypothetical protein [bacterium]MBU1874424.1 hypothetical protein [bacterium]
MVTKKGGNNSKDGLFSTIRQADLWMSKVGTKTGIKNNLIESRTQIDHLRKRIRIENKFMEKPISI